MKSEGRCCVSDSCDWSVAEPVVAEAKAQQLSKLVEPARSSNDVWCTARPVRDGMKAQYKVIISLCGGRDNVQVFTMWYSVETGKAAMSVLTIIPNWVSATRAGLAGQSWQ